MSAHRRPLASLLLLALLTACAGSDPSASAVDAPFSAATADPGAADRIVRLHTRLMVAGLACGPSWRDPQAFRHYSAFVSRNAPVLSAAQRDMAGRMGSQSGFDSAHTDLSNRESQRMIRLGTPAYCAEMRPSFYAAMAAGSHDLVSLPD